MNQLLATYDILSNGHTVEFLDVLSIVALLFGITVITNKNPIASLIIFNRIICIYFSLFNIIRFNIYRFFLFNCVYRCGIYIILIYSYVN